MMGPLIVGPSISVDDWVPERPPKKPHLRAAFSQQQPASLQPPSAPATAPVSSAPPHWPPIPPLPTCDSVLAYNCPSPDLPPPSPPPTIETEVSLPNFNYFKVIFLQTRISKIQNDFLHAAQFKMYWVGFRAFKSLPLNPLLPSGAVQKQKHLLERIFLVQYCLN